MAVGGPQIGLDLRVSVLVLEHFHMADLIQRFLDQTHEYRGDVWDWFNRLTREEWVVVLAVVATLGFLCMLGFGSRSKY